MFISQNIIEKTKYKVKVVDDFVLIKRIEMYENNIHMQKVLSRFSLSVAELFLKQVSL
jgi:hypothetical protein